MGQAILSSGKTTPEVRVFEDGKLLIHESSPAGATVGKNEHKREQDLDEAKALVEETDIENTSQERFDQKISELGSKVSTPVSLALLRCKAADDKTELHDYLRKNYSISPTTPKVISNVINGGDHASGKLSFCESMIIPQKDNLKQNILASQQVYQDLKNILEKDYGDSATLTGREGGFAPEIEDPHEVLDLITRAIENRNENEVKIAIDVAANNFCRDTSEGFEYEINGELFSTDELVDYYLDLVSKFDSLAYLEDPFHEEDLEGWKLLHQEISDQVKIVADDLTVTSISEIKKKENLFDAVILKPNQIGTFTSLYKAYKYAKNNDIDTIISQRSGETDTPTISDLGTGLGSEYLKIGPTARERIVKYNRLLRFYQLEKGGEKSE